MKKIAGIVCVLSLLLCGCSGSTGEETTVSGMVISVEGTQVKLLEISSDRQQSGERPDFGDGQMPSVPEGEMPSMPAEGERPTFPEGERPSMPEDGTRPTRPEGETPPQGGQWSDRFAEMEENAVTVDLSGAHISVEIHGVKSSGSMEDITVGVSVTVTMVDGKATYALVSQGMGFGGRGQGGFGNSGGGKNRGETEENAA